MAPTEFRAATDLAMKIWSTNLRASFIMAREITELPQLEPNETQGHLQGANTVAQKKPANERAFS